MSTKTHYWPSAYFFFKCHSPLATDSVFYGGKCDNNGNNNKKKKVKTDRLILIQRPVRTEVLLSTIS